MQGDWLGLSLVGGAALGALAYAIRVFRRGRVEHSRLTGVSSGMLGRPLMEAGYWLFSPITRFCLAVGITPNQLTWLSLFLGAAAGVCVGAGRLGIAATLATVSAMCDLFDGEVARAMKISSDAGEVLDAAADRYTEFFFLAGAAVYYRDVLWQMCVPLAALLASFMVSYATAKAEALRVKPPGGAMRRHERTFFLLLGLALSPAFAPIVMPAPLGSVAAIPFFLATLMVAIVGNLSAARRLYLTAKLVK
jgi:CDP-diacylglycerol--glycerol-3-phosphate 3-phosphatidyltransferase